MQCTANLSYTAHSFMAWAVATLMNVSHNEPLPSEDVLYVGQIVAQRTGLPQQEAQKRVSD